MKENPIAQITAIAIIAIVFVYSFSRWIDYKKDTSELNHKYQTEKLRNELLIQESKRKQDSLEYKLYTLINEYKH